MTAFNYVVANFFPLGENLISKRPVTPPLQLLEGSEENGENLFYLDHKDCYQRVIESSKHPTTNF